MSLAHFQPGTLVGGVYRIVQPLSQGGMGAVYLAEQVTTRKARALKVMRPELVGSEKLRERFVQEAQIGSRIESEHVVEVIDAGIDPATGTPWLAMELLKGQTLADLCRFEPLSVDRARGIFAQLCHALGAAHDAGIVHRDLKPENVFLADSKREDAAFTVKVLDFGIAKLLTDAGARATSALGTPLYMPPEQMSAGDVIGPPADVWALGLIAFFVLTGKPYWVTGNVQHPNAAMLANEVLNQPMVAASQRAAELGCAGRLPPGFDAWFARCVNRDIDGRFANARGLRAQLDSVFGGASSGWANAVAPQQVSAPKVGPSPLTSFVLAPTAMAPPTPSTTPSGSSPLAPAGITVLRSQAGSPPTPLPGTRFGRRKLLIGGGAAAAGIGVAAVFAVPRFFGKAKKEVVADGRFVARCEAQLKERLGPANVSPFLPAWVDLKQYLMLGTPEHVDVEWAGGRYTRLHLEVTGADIKASDERPRVKAESNIGRYFDQLKRGVIAARPLDDALIARVRGALQALPTDGRLYDRLVNSLDDELIDEVSPPGIDNSVFPAVTVQQMFRDLPRVLKHVSGRKQVVVPGPYTEKGHAGVARRLQLASRILTDEEWILPRTTDETEEKVPKHVAAVRTQYEQAFIEVWLDFFDDLKITTPTSIDEAVEVLTMLETDHPHIRLFGSLDRHTQWADADPLAEKDAITREVNRRFNERVNRHARGVDLDDEVRKLAREMTKVPARFKSAAEFGLGRQSKLFRYLAIVGTLRRVIEPSRGSGKPLSDFNDAFSLAREQTAALLRDHDATAHRMLKPLLMMPITVGVPPPR